MKTLFVNSIYSYQIHSTFKTNRHVISTYPTARLGFSQSLAFGKATLTSSISTAVHESSRTDHLSFINSAVGQCGSIYYSYERDGEN